MSSKRTFTEEQQQYLAGFAFGADVARAVNGLPVISGRDHAFGTTISPGTNGSMVPESGKPVGPECIARQAQQDTIQSGGKLCKEERAKQGKNPLDMWDELEERALEGAFPIGTDVFLTKFQGLFYVAPAQNSYMCRLRLPGGLLHGRQLRGLADLSDHHAGGYLDVTTRANLQLREIAATSAMEILYGLRELDIINLGSGGDNIRNCTASPLSGIDADELIETIPLAKRMHHYILNHRELYGLPRKFNIAFDGGGRIGALEDTNDIGFRALEIHPDNANENVPSGVHFQLMLGGITGHRDFARDTGILLTPRECIEVAGEIVRVFIRHGDRTDRKKARLKYLLDDWGFEKFIQTVESGLKRSLNRFSVSQTAPRSAEDRFAHVGVHSQKQAGMNYVGVTLPVGRLTSEQSRSLAHIADVYGNGEIRLTVWQNLLIPFIRDHDVETVTRRVSDLGLNTDAGPFRAGLIACTGSTGCKFAGADTKKHAMEFALGLEQRFQLDEPINIHVTGCHHSCAQHYIGDIGLQGCQVERGDDMVDGYHVHIGGGWGTHRGIARCLFKSVAAEEVPALLDSIISSYLANRIDQELFVEFAGRHSDQELISMIGVDV